MFILSFHNQETNPTPLLSHTRDRQNKTPPPLTVAILILSLEIPRRTDHHQLLLRGFQSPPNTVLVFRLVAVSIRSQLKALQANKCMHETVVNNMCITIMWSGLGECACTRELYLRFRCERMYE
ncbi:hypothetical protein Hdeb2414_s0013g00401851 [Helianthus debilis subsp. tardiflorus]